MPDCSCCSTCPLALLSPPQTQVCGLRWSPDDRELASGGNDNQLFVWHQQVGGPRLQPSYGH